MRDKFRGKRAKMEQGTVLSVSLTPDGEYSRSHVGRLEFPKCSSLPTYSLFAHVFHMPLNLESIADFVCKSPHVASATPILLTSFVFNVR